MNDIPCDLLYGAVEIGRFLGLRYPQVKARLQKGELPTFKMGRNVCARKSTLTRWLDQQEAGEPRK